MDEVSIHFILIQSIIWVLFIILLSIHSIAGHSGINLVPVDPLHIPSIGIKQGAESPVNIELKFNEVDLIGLSNTRFTKLT